MKSKYYKAYQGVDLNTVDVELRPYRLSDFEACRKSHKASLGKKKTKSTVPDSIPIATVGTRDGFKKKVERFRRLGRLGVCFVFGVFDRDGGHLGQIDIMTINDQLRWGNIGVQFHKKFRGKGFGTQAAWLAMHAAFGPLEYHRIEAGTDPKNHAAKGLIGRLGLDYEGKRRDFFPGPKIEDLMVYATNARSFKRFSESV